MASWKGAYNLTKNLTKKYWIPATTGLVGSAVAGEDNRLTGFIGGVGAAYGGKYMYRNINKLRRDIIPFGSKSLKPWSEAAKEYFSPAYKMGVKAGAQVLKSPISTGAGIALGAVGGAFMGVNPIGAAAVGGFIGNTIGRQRSAAMMGLVAGMWGSAFMAPPLARGLYNEVRQPDYRYNMYPAQSPTGRRRGNFGATGDLSLSLYQRRHGAI